MSWAARRARRFERARQSDYQKMVRTHPAGMAREEAILAVSETFWTIMGKRWCENNDLTTKRFETAIRRRFERARQQRGK